jgi:hypothetical protein
MGYLLAVVERDCLQYHGKNLSYERRHNNAVVDPHDLVYLSL